ncbi:SusC/RagA family TonB-linked outer membrane protein [Lacibacter sediminis]|uniref:SusC/RagA family TonB-linked outer membrane protein n=1 Tax=Lacibacter sediminis TaxID=2760713 RepID=A0A7G5XKF0_9BACT|nr:SusC/RagA family TonB-linked outer membrane protein [Lacibacter sediminis]QNA45953.1 SusC/RagA family TonB-linked outer membrane protein [Lacibacter sediminis]
MLKKKITFSLFLCFCSILAFAQTKTVTGKITSADNTPLSGATVMLKNSTTSTTTGNKGTFSISVPANSSGILVITYVGFESREFEIGELTTLDVKLTETSTGLNEVVVVGYGTQKKSDIISSVASIKPEKATRNATLDVGEMLRGKAAGVMITTSDAGPNGSSNILIRGRSSISGGTAPIVIADGVRIGSINDLNPNDIAGIEILKDAAAQAIYGARASNGVILITTKRGKTGKLSVNYNGYYGTQTAKRNFDVYNGQEFAQLKREADRAVNRNIMRSDALIFSADELAAISENRSIDWSGEILKPASIQNHDLSFSAGNEKTKIYVGGNYQHMTGIVPTTNTNKGTVRVNIDQVLTSWLKAGVNTSFQNSVSSDPGVSGIVRQIVTASPLGNIYNADGSYNVRPGGNQESFNPLLNLKETQNRVTNRNDIINIFFDVSPIKGFNYRLNTSRRSWNFKELNYNTKLSESGVANGFANGSIFFQENVEWLVENILSYNTRIRSHNFNFTLVGTASEQDYYSFRNSASKIPNDILGIYGLEAAMINVPDIAGNKRRLLTGVSRIIYDYASKYSAQITYTGNGSSVFGTENKWGFFPAVAVGWNIHREKFMSNFKHLSNLKLRASYGSAGNEANGPYGSLSLANQVDYLFGVDRISGYTPGSTLSNPMLKWETSTTLNFALDFGLFGNRLSGTVEYYNKRTTDLLVNRQLNASIGYTSQPYNIGEIENKGLELQIDAIAVDKKDLKVQAGLIFSKNKNSIIRLYGDLNGDGREDDDVGNNWFIGQPISIFRQPKYLGVWQALEVYPGSTFNSATGKWEINGVQAPVALDKNGLPIVDPFTGRTPVPGSVKIEDKNGDGKINADDNYITSQNPDWMGSFNLSAIYKGFDISVDIYTVQGIIRNNQFLYDYTAGGDLRGNRNGIKVDYWTPENPSNTYPQPNAGTSPPGMTNLGLQDASYWRLQNVTLGYTFSPKVVSRLKLNSLRFYATGQNLLTITDYQAYSPEQDLYAYPMTRNFIFGLKLGL